MNNYQKYNYLHVTLKTNTDTVREVAEKHEWSNGHAADYLIALGAKVLKGEKNETL